MFDFLVAGAIFFFAGLLLYIYLDYRDYKKAREFLKIEK
jgi:hypothetical protein